MDKYFAELLGAFAGDGWMSKGKSSTSLFITGNTKDEKQDYDERISFLFQKVFDKKVNPRNYPYWRTYGIYVSEKRIIDAFVGTGMPVGEKSMRVKVPELILSDKMLMQSFLRGLFDTDGCICFSKSYNKNASKWQKSCRHIPEVFISTISKQLAEQTSLIFQSINLQPTTRIIKSSRGYKPSYRIYIRSKSKTKQFFKIVQPKNQKHLDRFNQWHTQGFY